MEEIDDIKDVEFKKEPVKTSMRRSLVDRRSGEDKRKRYSLDYFSDGGDERRKGKERRQSEERRSGWARVYKWCSVFLGKKAS
jgi:hypothetical protein